jgi:hypothetical protein
MKKQFTKQTINMVMQMSGPDFGRMGFKKWPVGPDLRTPLQSISNAATPANQAALVSTAEH